jgi:uncharacterized protein (TIGR02270 family)
MDRAIRSTPVIIPNIVDQHVQEVSALFATRARVSEQPGNKLRDLLRFDERLAAHLEGLTLAGEAAWPFVEETLASASGGAVFTNVVRAVEAKDDARLDRLFALAEAVPTTHAGLTFAFEWLEREQLRGIVARLLGAQDSFKRTIGIAACAMHRIDPGLLSARRIVDTSRLVRSRALRAAGEIGCQEAASACAAAIHDEDSDCSFWAAWSSVLLGNRGNALDALKGSFLAAGRHGPRAFCLLLQTLSPAAAHAVLRELAEDPQQLRTLIRGSGVAGDPVYVPWLIKNMADEKTARIAGEAFSLISGADLDRLRLERNRPEGFESGPNDDPGDPNVEMDEDDGLPWPDVAKIEEWWEANAGRFDKSTRYFMGAPVTREHCIDVLKNGYQRQRILAAHYLCLLEPGTPLFNTSAPASRQQRLLAKMS